VEPQEKDKEGEVWQGAQGAALRKKEEEARREVQAAALRKKEKEL
jgi:hypothetical protein